MKHAHPAALPLSVAVLVALYRHSGAGGHVKSWERFAEAATTLPERIDLTVHFLGEAEGREDLSRNVRLKTWRPRLSTRSLPFLGATPGDTDIAPHHRSLSEDLVAADVIHTTDAYFSFTGSARRTANRTGTPLVTSVHTDTPGYARAVTERLLTPVFGNSFLTRTLPERLEHNLARRLHRHQSETAFTLVSSANQRESAIAAAGIDRVRHLARGIDFDRFTPSAADRAYLDRKYAVPQDRFLIAYAGRLDCCKNVDLLPRAFSPDLMQAMNAHLLFVGDGPERLRLNRHFGDTASLPGVLPQADVARALASADLFIFPSKLETFGNVIRESLASGTAAFVSDQGSGAGDVIDAVTGRYLPSDTPSAWREAVAQLTSQPARAKAWGRAAATMARERFPSWREVLLRDLIPVWEQAAGSMENAAHRRAA